ncbi:MAG TPA: hypothetical protein VGH15_03545 [Caulobacteraceae bacterium]|jgi:hypothetical protein
MPVVSTNVGGYTVATNDYLSITTTGAVGDKGVFAGAGAGITNDGSITSGAYTAVRTSYLGVSLTNNSTGVIRGGDGATGAAGAVYYDKYAQLYLPGGGSQGQTGFGGVALNYSTLANSGTFANYGSVAAGKGGVGGVGANEPTDKPAHSYSIGAGRGGDGGAGGEGVDVYGLAGATNGGHIAGGAGGAGGQGGLGSGQSGAALGGNGGSGGGGGVGLYGGNQRFINQPATTSTTYGSIHGIGTIVGGAGGEGVAGTSETNPAYPGVGGQGGNGGYGGAGVRFTNGEFDNFGVVTGGAGGDGGNGGLGNSTGSSGFAGNAGGGAYGLFAAVSDVFNYGSITGGHGGVGGASYNPILKGGVGGRGGSGVALLQSTLFNYGVITGGAGGDGGPGSKAGTVGTSGPGVIMGLGSSLLNDGGTITGSLGVYVVAFPTPNGNTVANYGGVISGTIDSVVLSGAKDVLVVGNKAKFVGEMVGRGVATLSLVASGTISSLGAFGTLSGGASGAFYAFANYDIGIGARWTLTGGVQLGSTMALTDHGTVSLSGGVNNAGGIAIVGGANNADFRVLTPGATLYGGGTVTLSGARSRIYGMTAATSLVNADNKITGAGQIGVGHLQLTNQTGGVIAASGGQLTLNTGSTVTNGGLIGSYSSGTLLVRDTTIDSTSGGSVVDDQRIWLDNGTLTGGAISIGAGGILVSAPHGGLVELGNGTISNGGTIAGTAGGLTIDGNVAGSGLIEALNGDLTISGAASGGKARIVGAGVLEIDGALQESAFFAAGSTGQLVLDDTAGFTGKIYGFATKGTNSLDLKDVIFDTGDTSSYAGSAAGGILTIKNSANAVIATVRFAGNYMGHAFVLSADGGTGTIVTDPPTVSKIASALAGFGAGGGSPGHSTAPAVHVPPTLASPGV